MVEFAAVLMTKQRMDWNKNAKDDKSEVFIIKPKNSRINSTLDKTNTKDETGGKTGDKKSKNIFDNCKLTKHMPPYRKMDVFSFVFSVVCTFVLTLSTLLLV